MVPNGQIRCRKNYTMGQLDGLCEWWWKRTNYTEDKLNGLYEEWYKNGQIKKNQITQKIN